VLPVPNYDIYSLPLKTIVADILVSMAGHVAVKVFLGEYWTGASSDFQNIRARLWTLANHGYFGPPVVMDMSMMGTGTLEGRGSLVERFWQQLEEQTEHLLRAHAPEVNAVAASLLKKGDLTGKECVEIIRAAAIKDNRETEGARVLKPLVEGSIIETQNNGDHEEEATPKKRKPRSKVKPEA
jgi:ATP-dependent Zn protease